MSYRSARIFSLQVKKAIEYEDNVLVYIRRMIVAALGALWIICYLPAILAFHTPLNAAEVLAEMTLIFLGILLVLFAIFFSIFYIGSRVWSAIDSRARPSL